jgi:hypothetical protein
MKNKKADTRSKEEEKDDNKFPGYPHYKQREDIMSGGSKEERIETDMENIPRNITVPGNSVKEKPFLPLPPEDDIELVPGNDADVTEEDLDELDRDGLQDRMYKPDDLDVPGSELDDNNEQIGEEDEENNYYSLGGDDKENLEENPDR